MMLKTFNFKKYLILTQYHYIIKYASTYVIVGINIKKLATEVYAL